MTSLIALGVVGFFLGGALYDNHRLRASRDRWRKLCVDQSDEWAQSVREMAGLGLGKPKAKRSSDWRVN